VKLDRVLDTIFVVSSFYETIGRNLERTAHAIDLNWVETKLSSLDGLLLAPDAKRAEELTKRNHHLSELTHQLRTKLLTLEDAHRNLTVLFLQVSLIDSLSLLYSQMNHQSLVTKFSAVDEENSSRRDRLFVLEQDLNEVQDLHSKAAQSRDHLIEAERARVEDLVHVAIQTEILTHDSDTQTEFIVPPVRDSLCIYLSCSPFLRSRCDIVSQRAIVPQDQPPHFKQERRVTMYSIRS
jgi:hypothetical protein